MKYILTIHRLYSSGSQPLWSCDPIRKYFISAQPQPLPTILKMFKSHLTSWKALSFHMSDSLYLNSHAKQTAHMLISETTELASGPFRVNSQEVVRSPSPIFLKFYSNCHYPIWWTSAKFEWNLSRNGM